MITSIGRCVCAAMLRRARPSNSARLNVGMMTVTGEGCMGSNHAVCARGARLVHCDCSVGASVYSIGKMVRVTGELSAVVRENGRENVSGGALGLEARSRHQGMRGGVGRPWSGRRTIGRRRRRTADKPGNEGEAA